MKVEVTTQTFEFNPRAFDKKTFIKAAKTELFDQMREINADAQAGKSRDGKLPSYSQSYKAWRKSQGYSTSTNLTLSGDMLRSMQVKETSDGAELFFQGNHSPKKSKKKKNKKKETKKKGTKSKTQTNAAIAAFVYSKGFDGWFKLGKKDQQRIQKSMNEVFQNIKIIK